MLFRCLRTVSIAFLLVIAGTCVQAQNGAKARVLNSQGDPDQGKRMLASAGCTACHGAQGQGTGLAPPITPPPLELGAMIAYVRQPTGKMPPFSSAAVSDENLADIDAYLKALSPPSDSTATAPGDASNGKTLFAAYGCYECHDRQGQGAATAPRIGPPRISFAAVLRYVRHPSGQMPPYTAKVASDQELADIYAYLSSFPPPVPSANVPLLN